MGGDRLTAMLRRHPSPTLPQATLLQRSWLVAAPVLATRMALDRLGVSRSRGVGLGICVNCGRFRHQQRIRLESALRARRS